MINHEDWLYRPVIRGLCKLESLIDGTLSLEDIAEANEALDVQDENEYRIKQAIDERRNSG